MCRECFEAQASVSPHWPSDRGWGSGGMTAHGGRREGAPIWWRAWEANFAFFVVKNPALIPVRFFFQIGARIRMSKKTWTRGPSSGLRPSAESDSLSSVKCQFRQTTHRIKPGTMDNQNRASSYLWFGFLTVVCAAAVMAVTANTQCTHPG